MKQLSTQHLPGTPAYPIRYAARTESVIAEQLRLDRLDYHDDNREEAQARLCALEHIGRTGDDDCRSFRLVAGNIDCTGEF